MKYPAHVIAAVGPKQSEIIHAFALLGAPDFRGSLDRLDEWSTASSWAVFPAATEDTDKATSRFTNVVRSLDEVEAAWARAQDVWLSDGITDPYHANSWGTSSQQIAWLESRGFKRGINLAEKTTWSLPDVRVICFGRMRWRASILIDGRWANAMQHGHNPEHAIRMLPTKIEGVYPRVVEVVVPQKDRDKLAPLGFSRVVDRTSAIEWSRYTDGVTLKVTYLPPGQYGVIWKPWQVYLSGIDTAIANGATFEDAIERIRRHLVSALAALPTPEVTPEVALPTPEVTEPATTFPDYVIGVVGSRVPEVISKLNEEYRAFFQPMAEGESVEAFLAGTAQYLDETSSFRSFIVVAGFSPTVPVTNILDTDVPDLQSAILEAVTRAQAAWGITDEDVEYIESRGFIRASDPSGPPPLSWCRDSGGSIECRGPRRWFARKDGTRVTGTSPQNALRHLFYMLPFKH